jgi:hypothetical protein
MAIAEIKEWLYSSGVYYDGVELFRKHGNNPVLLSIFETIETTDTLEMLQDKLRSLADADPEAAKESPPAPEPVVKRFQAPADEKKYQSLDDEVKRLVEEKNSLFKQMSYIHSRLLDYKSLQPAHNGHEILVDYNNFTNEEEAGDAALEILNLDVKIRTIWADLDYYETNGKLPEKRKKEQPILTAILAMKRRNALRSYVSREPGSIKIDQWRAEIRELEDKFDL